MRALPLKRPTSMGTSPDSGKEGVCRSFQEDGVLNSKDTMVEEMANESSEVKERHRVIIMLILVSKENQLQI